MKKILLVGVVCFSMLAFAQTNGSSATTKNPKGPREAASGQASGKQGKPAARESSAPSVSEITVTKASASGREASVPSVSEATVKAPSNGQAHVATGDLNGDGMPDRAASHGSSSGKGQNANEVAHGQMSGKRQHEPVQIKKELDKASPKL